MRILFDIGGSKMRISGTTDGEEFIEPIIQKTPITAEEGVDLFFKVVEDIIELDEIEGIWGGITGVWDKDRCKLSYSPNMPGWVNKPIRELFSVRSEAPFVVENDADVVGLGEVHFGAGRGSEICVYMTISTGVGGARIVNGELDRAFVGFEPGHHIINQSELDPKELSRCLEDGRMYKASLEGHISGTALKKATGKDPVEIEDSEVWEKLAFQSAVGIYNAILFWSPDTVVVGGSMVVGSPDIPIDRIRHYVQKLAHFLPSVPEIKKAELGAIGGIYGAMVLSRPLG